MIKAKKEFGQNFLIDRSVVDKIVESMPHDNIPVVEIGPGLGDLTTKLLEYKGVKAFEIDRDLVPRLQSRFEKELKEGSFSIVEGDVLKYWQEGSLSETPYHLVANLPYYISTAIILKALDDPHCQTILVMVQKEVGEKFCAVAGEKEFSSLSVLTTLVGGGEVLFEIPPTAFNPPPKVTSCVIRIIKQSMIPTPEKMKKFLSVAFSQPRKTLQKNLSAAYAKSKIIEALKDENLSETIRPHEVEAPVFKRLADTITL